jgi:protein CpxP
MRTVLWALGIAVLWAIPVTAQDSSGTADSAGRERLQRQIAERFGQVVQRQLGLTNAQMERLRTTEQRFRPQRQAITRRQVLVRTSLQAQMRPGEAADADSVRKLMAALQENRAELLHLDEEQDREMAAYLTPVQRARYQFLRERLMRRLQDVRRERRMDRQPGRGPRGPRG